MNKNYFIDGKKASIMISKKLYPLISVKKAIANFMDKAYVILDESKDNILLQLQIYDENINIEKIIGEFYNELLRESIRYEVQAETKELRELIVARALYTTCVEVDDGEKNIESNYKSNSIENDEDYSIDDIAVNWFDRNMNKEE